MTTDIRTAELLSALITVVTRISERLDTLEQRLAANQTATSTDESYGQTTADHRQTRPQLITGARHASVL